MGVVGDAEGTNDALSTSVTKSAVRTLTGPVRWPIGELSERLEPVPGLYAVFGTDAAWDELGLPLDGDSRPLYVGKAEDSFVSRDLRTHFASGRTGQSTVRRSFAALLHESAGFRAVPRNPEVPGHFANFGLTADDDARLTEWMWDRLSLAVWPSHGNMALRDIERRVILLLDPPLNIEYLPRTSRRELRAARRLMADEARRWKPDQAIG